MGITRANYAKIDTIIRRVNTWDEFDPETPKRWGLSLMINMEDLEGLWYCLTFSGVDNEIQHYGLLLRQFRQAPG
jgi:hypothetical protein